MRCEHELLREEPAKDIAQLPCKKAQLAVEWVHIKQRISLRYSMPFVCFILQEISQYLEIKYASDLRRVNKYWYSCLTPVLFGHIKLSHRLTFEDQLMVTKYGQFIQSLYVQDQLSVLVVLEDLFDDVHLFSRVTSLHVTIDCGEKFGSLSRFCSQLPSLHSLTISGVFTDLPKYFTFPTIRTLHLNIQTCYTIHQAVEKIRCPALKTLSIFYRFNHRFPREALVTKFPTLKRFQLGNSSAWIDFDLSSDFS